MPALPALPGGATVVTSNASLIFTVDAGATRVFKAADISAAAPGCPSLVWVAAWTATDPLTATVRTDTSSFNLGRGRWGTADMACSWVELRNDTSAPITGQLTYSVGSR